MSMEGYVLFTTLQPETLYVYSLQKHFKTLHVWPLPCSKLLMTFHYSPNEIQIFTMTLCYFFIFIPYQVFSFSTQNINPTRESITSLIASSSILKTMPGWVYVEVVNLYLLNNEMMMIKNTPILVLFCKWGWFLRAAYTHGIGWH